MRQWGFFFRIQCAREVRGTREEETWAEPVMLLGLLVVSLAA